MSTSPHVGTIQKIIHWEAFPVQSSFSSRFLNFTIWEQELGVPFTWSKTPSKCLSKIKSMGFLQKWPYSPGAAGRIAGRCHKRSLSLLHMVPVYLQRGSVRLLFSSFCSWEIWGSENLNTLSMVSLQATVKIANTHEIGQNSRHQNLLGKDKSQLPGLMRAEWVPSFPDSLSVQGGVEEVKMVSAGCLMGRPLGFWFCDGNRMSTSLPWEKPFQTQNSIVYNWSSVSGELWLPLGVKDQGCTIPGQSFWSHGLHLYQRSLKCSCCLRFLSC